MADPFILSQERLVAKEVALGVIREIPPPQNHIGLQIAPFQDVQSDEVIFQYVSPEVDGLAPARAEDAESELAQHDDTFGQGRASLIDWALKDHYDPSDISRYREYLRLAQAISGGQFPLTIGSMIEDFSSKVARDQARRRRKLDNRLEWLIMTALDKGVIAYNDGKIVFSVDYKRPAGQTAQTPNSGVFWDAGVAHDPIGDLIHVQDFMYDTYFSHIDKGIISLKALRTIINSDRFAARAGIAGVYTGSGARFPDPRYLGPGGAQSTPPGGGAGGGAAPSPAQAGIPRWDYMAALAVVEAATGIRFTIYDSVFRTRAIGSKTVVNHRFTDEKNIILLPADADMAEVDDTSIGFAKTLTSPHPEGGWSPGFYEWEQETTDPWGRNLGTGIKAFPVFPHMEYTYTLKVLT